MDLLTGLEQLFVVVAISAAAPLLAALIPHQRIPQVVLLLVGGMLIGEGWLGIDPEQELELISNVGLGFVFLLAGFEIDPAELMGRAGRLALTAWILAAICSVLVVGLLAALGYVEAFVPVALALTTTALGTVLPILREQGILGGAFGRHFLASGAVGEMLPVLAMAIFLGVNSRLAAVISIVAIGLIALLLAWAPRVMHGRRLSRIVTAGADTTGQTTVRCTVVLLVGLLVVAGEFGLDVVLGAFLAGAVLRRWVPGEMHAFESKLDAVGYGFFIPVFFVVSGMEVDVASLRESPTRLLLFLLLLLAVRGLPVLLVYRRALVMRERTQLMLCTATTLPLIVALTQIGLDSGTMLPENAAALVGAGVLSVLLFPLVTVLVHRPSHTELDRGTAQPAP
ncbi:MAG TPA: cation:proton antiporter [Intrasporangium sp.]|nr:cation:proton antiporter [Intrasporangium sp.]